MMSRYCFYMISIIVMSVFFSIATLTVSGQGECDIAMEREYYEALEDAYTLRMRTLLSDKGYHNAGITMTKIYEADGSREYTVQIHHRKIDRLSEGERILLQNELNAICFGDERCQVLHKFLSYEE